MEILDVETIEFTYESRTAVNDWGHTHPSGRRDATQVLTRLVVDGGPDGYFFGGSERGNEYAAPRVTGRDPLEREAVWRRLARSRRLGKETLSNLELAAIDCALWDVAGRRFDQPVYALLGGTGGDVPACAYTMNGDDDPEGLGTPAAYADFATSLVEDGYAAINLHGWMPPYDVDPERDVAACAAVRDAVGEDVDLMFTPYHHYGRDEVVYIGRALGELGFRWIEEPMDEYSRSSYGRLADELDVPVMGAKSIDGNVRSRAEWIKRGVSDAVRVHVGKCGGLTPAVRTASLCDAFGVPCAVGGSTAPTLQLLGLPHAGEYYHRGTLHPFVDYDASTPWLAEPLDPLSDDGTLRVPDGPGLGYDIDWEFIEENRI